MKKSIQIKGYKKLINDITTLYDVARSALVEAYWQIANRIVEEEQQGQENAIYGDHLLDRLSQDLSAALGSGFSIRNLRKMRQFYLAHEIRPAPAELTWTQHVGQKARQYVRRTLKACPCIVIQTHKTDKYDRYLSDIFYLPGSQDPDQIGRKGHLLNQTLLDKGMAQAWKD